MPSRRWGACLGDLVTTKYAPLGTVKPLALGTQMDCGAINACDPYCNYVEDTPSDVPTPPGICGVPGGFSLCSACSYNGPTGSIEYSALPATLRRNPATCDDTDECSFDRRCNDGTCQSWASPCYAQELPDCALDNKVDLMLGPPCVAPGNQYHFPVCNRGSGTVNAGALRIGVYNSPAAIGGCVDLGAPDRGYATFTLGAGPAQSIPPGSCIDVNPGNSTNTFSETTFASDAAIAVNYDAGVLECNGCNNWNVWTTAASCSGCTGLQCNQTCAETTLTGIIRDPRGVNPLPGVVVYVPNGAVQPFVDGVACDTCSNLYTGSPLVSTVTAADGSFTLPNVPAGVSFPLVIQTGRWRRQVTVPAITACGTATLAGDLARLPKNKAEGDIPKMALMMAEGDQLQCLFRKIGIEDSEFTTRTGNGRIHLFRTNGPMSFSGIVNGLDQLYAQPARLDDYSAIIAPCDNAHVNYNHSDYPSPAPPPTATPNAGPNYQYPPAPSVNALGRANVKAYLDAGGRLFTTHWMAFDFTYYTFPSAVTYIFGSNVDADRNPPAFTYTIDTSSPLGSLFSSWAGVVNASPGGAGTVTFNSWRHLSESVNPPTIRLAYGDSRLPPLNRPQNSSVWGGPQVSIFQFDTPWDAPAESQCGRVVAAMSHVSSGSGGFPGGCGDASAAMSPQEKAFEFLVFNTTQCVGTVTPPPAVTPLNAATFTRDFEADCPDGHKPEWQLFSWQAVVPPGTSIQFEAASADTQAELAGAAFVGIGSANDTTTTWTSDPNTVSDHLEAANLASRRWLRVAMTLNPTGAMTPTLTNWRQLFSCLPAE